MAQLVLWLQSEALVTGTSSPTTQIPSWWVRRLCLSPLWPCLARKHKHCYSGTLKGRKGWCRSCGHTARPVSEAYLLCAEFAAACITAAAASWALRFTVGIGGPIPGPPCWDMPGELGVTLLMFPGNGLFCIPAEGIRPRGIAPHGWVGPCPCIWLLALIPIPGPGPL